MQLRRLISCLTLAPILIVAASDQGMAFCPMCSSAIEGSTRAGELSGALSSASLVLLAPPLMIFVAAFVLFYRLRDSWNLKEPEGEVGEEAAGRFDG